MSYILVLDQGTHASRAIVFSLAGDIIEQTQTSVSLQQINQQIIEQDASELLESLIHCIKQLKQSTLKKITLCSLCTQRSTIVAWHKQSGDALGPAISWQDRRSDADLLQFKNRQDLIKQITGLPLSAHYGSGKIRWLLKHNKKVNQALIKNNLIIAPLASFLLFNLLKNKPYLIDHSNAHRSLLFDLNTLDWSKNLLTLFDIPAAILPTCVPVLHEYGNLACADIPVTAVCGDQSAAFFSQGQVKPNSAVINIGTGAFILAPSKHLTNPADLLAGIACSDSNTQTYLLEGTVNGAGSALSWAQKIYPIENLFDCLAEWLGQVSSPPIFINTIGGLGSPWWISCIDAHFIDDEESTLAERYVAIIESIAFLIQHNLLHMQNAITLETLSISGGLSRLDALCQKISDLSQLSVARSSNTEGSASGGAWLAAGCPSEWQQKNTSRVFLPNENPALIQRFHKFSEALHRLK